MLNYEAFKKIIAERLMNFMPEPYQNCRIKLDKVQKVNRTFDTIEIISGEEAKRKIAPTFYIDSLYELYMESGDLQMALQTAADKMTEAMEKSPQILEKIDYWKAEEQIIMSLVNTEQNKQWLQNVPHRQWQDLSIVYRWVIDRNEEGFKNMLVNNELAGIIGMDEKSLYTVAVKNTMRIFPPQVEPIDEVVKKIWLADGMPQNVIESMIDKTLEESVIYVISNINNIFGAVSILYENVLHELAEKIGSDLYLMLSSVHEIMAVPASGDPNELARMVKEINLHEVPLEEQLSNQVYHYDKDLRKVSMATDTPDKRLDSLLVWNMDRKQDS